MLASLILLRRLPKAFDTFTYLVPPELCETLQVGQLVQIPFRNSQTLGIIFSLEQTDTIEKTKIKPISQIIFPQPFLSPEYLVFLKKVSQLYGVALSTLCENALPSLTTRTTAQLSVAPLPTRSHQRQLPLYKKYSNTLQHQQCIVESIHGQTIIFVPEKQYLQTVFDFLPKEMQKQTVFWHGELKTTEQRKIWTAIRNKEKNIILSTRSGAFLPLMQLDTLIVDYEHHKEHKNADQAPRFHIKDITPLIRQYSGATEIHMSYCPSMESYYGLYKGGYANTNAEETLQFTSIDKKFLPRIKDMRDERKAGNLSPLCEEVENLVQNSPGDIFLFINRKGAGSVMICKDCRYEEKCPTCALPFVYHADQKILSCHYCKIQKPVPLSCKQCGSVVLEFKGVGTESVEKRVKELLKGSQKQILRIEGEQEVDKNELPNTPVPKVIIGTEKAFEYIDPTKTSCIVMLDLDRQVSLPEFKASEYAWDLIQELQYIRAPQSQYIIQTWDTKQLLIKSLSEPDRFYRTNLSSRQGLHYPPYGFLVRYFYGAEEAQNSLYEAKKIKYAMEVLLTKYEKQAILTDPIEMQPKYFRGRWWYGIIMKTEAKDWQEIVLDLHSHIPDGWKIDLNPNTLLHP